MLVWREPGVGRQEDPRLPVPTSCEDWHFRLGCFWSQETLLLCDAFLSLVLCVCACVLSHT